MGAVKWIGGLFGLFAGGPIGAIAGYVFGSMVDSMFSGGEIEYKEEDDSSRRRTEYQSRRQTQNEELRNGYLFSLLLLAAHIIQADGKIMHSEM